MILVNLEGIGFFKLGGSSLGDKNKAKYEALWQKKKRTGFKLTCKNYIRQTLHIKTVFKFCIFAKFSSSVALQNNERALRPTTLFIYSKSKSSVSNLWQRRLNNCCSSWQTCPAPLFNIVRYYWHISFNCFETLHVLPMS